jgi:sugar phosphate permease
MSVCCYLIVRNKPSDYGLLSIEEVEYHEGKIKVDKQEEADLRQTISAWTSIKTVLSNKYTWPPFLAAVGIYGAFISFSGLWGVPYFMQIYGMSRIDAANHVLVSSFGFMAIAPVVGYISDKIRLRRLPYTVCAILLLLSWLGLTFWHSGKPPEWALYPLCFLMGAGVAATTMPVPCAREVNLPSMTGVAVGIANAGGFAGAALIQPLFGWILDLGWQGTIQNGVKIYPQEAFWTAFVFCTVIAAISVGLTLMVKETRCVNVAHEIISNNTSCKG